MGIGRLGGGYDIMHAALRISIAYVVAYSIVKQKSMLIQKMVLMPQRSQRNVTNIDVNESNGTGGDIVEAVDQISHRAFAHPADAYQRDHFAGVDAQVDVLQDQLFTITEAHVVELDGFREPLSR